MAAAQASGSEPRLYADGIHVLALHEDKNLSNIYARLAPEQRTWRCKQINKGTVLLEESWGLLRPISEGHWDKEECYNGLALFVKGIYESQGYPVLPSGMSPSRMLGLIRVIEEHLMCVEVGGRRLPADDNAAEYALRVAFTGQCLVMLWTIAMSNCSDGAGAQQLDETLLRAVSCLDKLGGPGLHEGALSAEQQAALALFAAAAATSDQAVERLGPLPPSLVALHLLHVLYGTELRQVKWVLLYVATRCAKEAYARGRTACDAAAMSRGRSSWLRHSSGLAALDPGGPLAAFMRAEAETSINGSRPDTLAALRKAAQAAEQRGDDVVAWLAHLNVAQTLLHGGEGERSFSEGAVLQALDSAAAQRSSLRRWGGTVLLENRCRPLRDRILEELEESRQLARNLQERSGAAAGGPGGSRSGCSGGPAPLPEGTLPLPAEADRWSVAQPAALKPRECCNCHKYFHKALQCGRCRQVWYCSRECQAAAWKAGHKGECAQLAAEAAGRAAAAEGAEGPPSHEDDD